jgi:multidrug resistance efflux pump
MCARQQFILKRRRVKIGAVTGLGTLVACLLASGPSPSMRSAIVSTGLPRVQVRRADLATSILASGHVESSVQTVIRCQMENLTGRRAPDGRRASAAILSLVPEGQHVRAGDVLCRLDTAEHEELARIQRMTVARARALQRRAELDAETAEISLREYVDGLCKLRSREFEGAIALAGADVARLADRLTWSRRLFAKGYVSKARLADDRATLERAEIHLDRLRREFRGFERFQSARTRRELENAVGSARTTLTFQNLSLRTEQARLAELERQIATAVIRAPHDGQVILAHRPRRNVRIEEGLWVRLNQPLMFLPDIRQLEVQVELHETIVDKVRPGMRVRVRPEGLDCLLDGELASIDPLPHTDNFSSIGPEARYFLGRVRLDRVPRTLKMGMTVQVKIQTATREEALVVPPRAICDDGPDRFCLVAAERGLQRRRVALGQSTPFWQEVTAGLQEGEEVVLVGNGFRPQGEPGNP